MTALPANNRSPEIPNIYFSYGMTKSGSTLGFELARTALEMAGFTQPIVDLPNSEKRKINFVSHLDQNALTALVRFTTKLGHTLALKTHTRPDPGVVALLQNGQASAHAIFRDPRDIALSMLDHGAKARSKNRQPFSEFVRLDDTIDPIRHQTNSLLAWLSLPNVRPLFYDDLAFATRATVTKILIELGLKTDANAVTAEVDANRFTQRNVARRNRHETEMDTDTSDRFRTIFAPFYDKLIDKAHDLPRNGSPVLNPNEPLCRWDAPARP